MVVTPAADVFTTPVPEPIVAIPVALLLHVPPAMVFASMVADPAQRLNPDDGPVIDGGVALTVIVVVAIPEAPAL